MLDVALEMIASVIISVVLARASDVKIASSSANTLVCLARLLSPLVACETVVGARRLLEDTASEVGTGEMITEEYTRALAAESASESMADSRTARPGWIDEAAE